MKSGGDFKHLSVARLVFQEPPATPRPRSGTWSGTMSRPRFTRKSRPAVPSTGPGHASSSGTQDHPFRSQSQHNSSSPTSPARSRARTLISADEEDAAEMRRRELRDRRERARDRVLNEALLSALVTAAIKDEDGFGEMHLFGDISYSYSSDVHAAEEPFQVFLSYQFR